MPSPSSAMRVKSASEGFFLRPYLTREEYLYWSSHLSHMPTSCACPTCAIPRETTATVMYQHCKPRPPVSVRNTTGIPSHGRPKPGFTTVRNNGFGGCFCGQVGCGPATFVPETLPSAVAKGKMTSNSPVCHSRNLVSKRSASGYRFKNIEFVKTPSSSAWIVPPDRQMGNDKTNRSLKNNSTAGYGAYPKSTSESLRRISELYLCGDKSFDEMPPAHLSSTICEEKSKKSRSPVLCDSTNAGDQHSKIESTASLPVKRKSTTEPELNNSPQSKHQRQTTDHGIHKAQTQIDTIDLNDNWKRYLGGALPMSGFKSGSKTIGEAQPMGKGKADGITYTTATTRVLQVGERTPNHASKSLERVDELFKAAKPIPRKLRKDGGTSSASDGYALDYDSLPKVVDVLPSKLATAISSIHHELKP